MLHVNLLSEYEYVYRSGDDELHLILGGRYMGKRTYALKLYGHFDYEYDLECVSPEEIITSGLITNIHAGIKNLMMRRINPREFFMSRIELLRHCVITGDEISCGVIPIDEFARKWRDETGIIYQELASEADIVDRIFAGLSLRLKG